MYIYISGEHFNFGSDLDSAHVAVGEMFAAFGAGRVSAVEHRVPSLFEANVAQHLRLERFERRGFSPQFGFHSDDLLLQFGHFGVR